MFYLFTIDVCTINDPPICRLREGKREADNKDWEEELHWTTCTSDSKSIVLLFLPMSINATSSCSFFAGYLWAGPIQNFHLYVFIHCGKVSNAIVCIIQHLG